METGFEDIVENSMEHHAAKSSTSTLFRDVQPWNAFAPILVKLLGTFMEIKLQQP
jgi:hypothetical protein